MSGRGGDTIPMHMGGLACALCGDHGTAGVNFPVITPAGEPRFPKVCQHCLSALLGVVLSIAAREHAEVARAVSGIAVTGIMAPPHPT